MTRAADPLTPVEVASRYVALFNAGRYAEMGGLFAPDAVWRRPPPAPEVRGGEAIVAGYGDPGFAAACSAIRITSARYIAQDRSVAGEFVFAGNGHTVHAIDLFEVDEQGRIASMTVFDR
jgi:ketosteroid isomerase-like protein